jgi:hypothetical protein
MNSVLRGAASHLSANHLSATPCAGRGVARTGGADSRCGRCGEEYDEKSSAWCDGGSATAGTALRLYRPTSFPFFCPPIFLPACFRPSLRPSAPRLEFTSIPWRRLTQSGAQRTESGAPVTESVRCVVRFVRISGSNSCPPLEWEARSWQLRPRANHPSRLTKEIEPLMNANRTLMKQKDLPPLASH